MVIFHPIIETFYWKWLHYIIISLIYTHFYFKSPNFLSTSINHNRLQFLSLFTLRTYYRENCSNSQHSTPRFLMLVLFCKRPSTFSCMSSVLQFLLIVEWTEALSANNIILVSRLTSFLFSILYIHDNVEHVVGSVVLETPACIMHHPEDICQNQDLS